MDKKQKYYDFDKAKKLADQNKDFVLGEHEAARKRFEEFELDVKGRGKSRKEKLALADAGPLVLTKDEDEVSVVDPEIAPDDESYVVVVNRNGLVPIRHIVAVEDYDRDKFIKSYYASYHKLEGDEFVFCPTREDRDRVVRELEKEFYGV